MWWFSEQGPFDIFPRLGALVCALLASAWLATISPLSIAFVRLEPFLDGAGQPSFIRMLGNPPDTEAPSVPTDLVATQVTQTTVTLAWKASTDNVGVTGYRLYEYLTVNHFYSYWLLRIDDIKLATVRVTGLEPGSAHRYAVTAFDSAGNGSARSATLRVRNLRPPQDYHPVRPGDGPVQAIVGERFTYEVNAIGVPAPTFSLVDGPQGMGVDSTTGTVQWTPMAGNEGIVTATVRAGNSEGRDDHTFNFPVHPAGTDLEPPSTARHLVAMNIVSNGATLSWDSATDNVGVVGYYIKAQQDGRGHSLFTAGKLVGPGTTYTMTRLKPGTGYRLWVAAYDAAGNVATISGVPPVHITTLALEPEDTSPSRRIP
jgi:chitodextrinase